MPESTAATQATPTPATQPETATYFWIATIEKRNGDKYHCHSTAQATPGTHTRASVTRDILSFLENRHGEFVLLSFSLEPDALPRPAVTQ